VASDSASLRSASTALSPFTQQRFNHPSTPLVNHAIEEFYNATRPEYYLQVFQERRFAYSSVKMVSRVSPPGERTDVYSPNLKAITGRGSVLVPCVISITSIERLANISEMRFPNLKSIYQDKLSTFAYFPAHSWSSRRT
jgi:hypothetical protein